MINHALPTFLLFTAVAVLALSRALQAAGRLNHWYASVSWNH